MRLSAVFVLAFGFFLTVVPALYAQQPKEQDSLAFESIRTGTRIEITLKNRSTFTGEVVEVKPDRVKLNLSYEKLGAEDYMTFYKREIKRVVLLSLVPVDEAARIKAERETAAKKAAEAAAASGATAAKTAAGAGTAESPEDKEKSAKEKKDAAKAEKRKKDQEIIGKFPSSEWNEERKDEIAAKPASSRTPEEQEFLESYDQVAAARDDEAKETRRNLLGKFPPPEWGQEKYDELKKTRFPAVEDVFMTELEKEFVENFGEWQKAYQEEQAEKAKESGASPSGGTPEEGSGPPEGTPTPPEEGGAPPLRDNTARRISGRDGIEWNS